MGKNFLGLDGLKHFWSKAKSWIAEQITAEVTAKIAQIVANAPEDLDTLKEIADWISTHANDASAMNTQINTNKSDITALKTSVAGKSDTGHTHTKSEITDFPTSLPANGGTATKASFLDEYVGAGGTCPKSGNIVPKDSSEYGGMRKDVVTSSMTEGGRPGMDGHLLTMFWDSNGRWDTQLFLNCEEPPALKVRVKQNTSDYGPWVDIITSQNIGSQTVSNASTANRLFYTQGNEINFKGGAQTQCLFNYRNADTGGPSPVDTMEYRFCNYSRDTSKSVLIAGSFNGATAKASSKMVIPIGAPSSLEDGCIWIER